MRQHFTLINTHSPPVITNRGAKSFRILSRDVAMEPTGPDSFLISYCQIISQAPSRSCRPDDVRRCRESAHRSPSCPEGCNTQPVHSRPLRKQDWKSVNYNINTQFCTQKVEIGCFYIFLTVGGGSASLYGALLMCAAAISEQPWGMYGAKLYPSLHPSKIFLLPSHIYILV